MDSILAAEIDIDFQLRSFEFTHWPIRNFHRIKIGVMNSDWLNNTFTAYKFGKISILNIV